MAKVNASKVKSTAAMAGIRKPPPPAGMRAPKPSQAKQAAKAMAKGRIKMMIRVLVIGLIVGAIALIVYFVKFHGRQPKDAFNTAIEYAYKDNVVKFSGMFTEASVMLVEDSEGNSEDVWAHLMNEVSPSQKPKVLSENITEQSGVKSAVLTVKIDGEDRTIHMLQEDGSWKINLNVALDPRKVKLPDDIPPEYVENFEVSDKPEAWWDYIDEDEKENSQGASKSKKKSGGFFSKFRLF